MKLPMPPNLLARSPVRALALLFVLAPNAQANGTVAHWTFEQTKGSVVNTQSHNNQNDGWIGYSPDNTDDNEVERNASMVAFNGARNSIILIDDANHTDFNPGLNALVISARFVVDRSVLDEDALGLNQTWNLVQKGRFNNVGGQWKMQIRKSHNGRLFLQCLVNDDKPETKSTKVQVVLKPKWINSDHIFEGRCELSRKDKELRVDLTNTTQGNKTLRKTSEVPAEFGAVAPQAGECGTPQAFGGNVAIGNKPLCEDQELDTDDAFRGTVFSIKIDV